MKYAFALAAFAASVFAQASIGDAPAGCDKSYNGNFEITIVKPSNLKRDLTQRQAQCGQTGILTLKLQNGDLTDNDGRTGYIASANSQFQFDKPVQAGGIYAGQFSVCKNGSIALGSTTTFYQCQSGSFFNLYQKGTAEQCSPVNVDIIPCDGSSFVGGAASSSVPTSVAAAAVSSSAKPVSVSSDGQPQGTAKPTSVVPVSVFSDGQPQATAAATSVKPAPVSVFTDGQPQATVAATSKAANNVTKPSAQPTIATGGASTTGVSFFFAGAMAIFALF